MRQSRTWVGTLVVAVMITLVVVPAGEARQGTEVYAEAVGQANLRGGPGIEYPVVGQISAGQRFAVLARHSLVPWLRLDYAAAAPGEAWVYADLVTVTGSLALVPAVSTFPAAATPAPSATATPAAVTAPGPSPAPTLTTTAAPSPTPTDPPRGPLATTLGEANIRFGPGVEYPVILRVEAGNTYTILEQHTLVPWLRIALAESPTGSGWIFREVIEISGDLSTVPGTNAIQFAYPTLTATPQVVVVSSAPWSGIPLPSGELARTLGQQMNDYLAAQGFSPFVAPIASVFVMDLRTGDTFTLNDNMAFSGMSLTKIGVLAAYFQRHEGPLTSDDAFLVADTMMCSENITTNDLLAFVGDGDPLRGAQRVTAFLQSLNLRGTFIMRQYTVQEGETPPGVGTVTTGFDQVSTRPDQFNQMLPRDLGWLLASMYQCADSETGLLLQAYPGDFNRAECRRMLYAMDANEIGVFIEAGVPAGTRVIHKHGWIDDSHGDAGIVIGPEGAYVIVVALYGRQWLDFELSTQVIGELSRLAWNHFNPSVPVDAVTPSVVPATCDPYSDPVMAQLHAPDLPMIGP